MEMLNEVYYVIVGMRAYGGGFVKSLAEALSHADNQNAEKIKAAFSDYWKKYLEMGINLEKKS